MNEGIQIAQRGSLVIHDPVVAAVPATVARSVLPVRTIAASTTARASWGSSSRSRRAARWSDSFRICFPASIAIGYGLDGLTGARRTLGVWAILGLLAVYFAGARLVGRLAAAAAAALLALNVIQVWFARYPNAEIVMQALLFAALLAIARAHRQTASAFFGAGRGLAARPAAVPAVRRGPRDRRDRRRRSQRRRSRAPR